MKIVWVSRHPPLEAQVEELKKMFGAVDIVQISKTFRDAGEVFEMVKREKPEIAVAVLPLSMLAQFLPLCKRENIDVWMARMDPVHECDGHCGEFDPKRDVWLPIRGSNLGRHLRFSRFERILNVKVITEPIERDKGMEVEL